MRLLWPKGFRSTEQSRAVVLSLWVATPLWSNSNFMGVVYQIFTLRFITVAKSQLRSRNETSLWLGHHSMRNCIKGHSIRRVENLIAAFHSAGPPVRVQLRIIEAVIP